MGSKCNYGYRWCASPRVSQTPAYMRPFGGRQIDFPTEQKASADDLVPVPALIVLHRMNRDNCHVSSHMPTLIFISFFSLFFLMCCSSQPVSLLAMVLDFVLRAAR